MWPTKMVTRRDMGCNIHDYSRLTRILNKILTSYWVALITALLLHIMIADADRSKLGDHYHEAIT